MAKKVQFMALVEPTTMHRLDALRIVTGQHRARVAEQAMTEGGLARLERANEAGLRRLDDIAGRLNVSVQALVSWYAAAYARQYGPGVDGIEAAYRGRGQRA